MGVQRVPAEGLGQRLRPRGDAQTFQKDALRGDARVGGGAGCAGDGLKIHMGGQVCRAGVCEGVSRFVIF